MGNKRKPISFPELEPRLEPKGRGAILRSVAEVEAETQTMENKNAGIPANKFSSNQAYKHSSIQDYQHTSKLNADDADNEEKSYEGYEDRNKGATIGNTDEEAGAQDEGTHLDAGTAKRAHQEGYRGHYTKVTYRLSPKAIEAIDEAKRVLRRRHNIKVSLEEIAEAAIIAVCDELLANQQTSKLVNKFAGKSVEKSKEKK